MREIKFRAINANNEIIYGLPFTDGINDTVYFKEYSNRLCWRDENGASCNQPYKNGTLMQYTGLKDKNGKDIYEGDIVEINTIVSHSEDVFGEPCDIPQSITTEVIYNDDFAGFDLSTIEPDLHLKAYCLAKDFTDDYEVIGNIYENPELLK